MFKVKSCFGWTLRTGAIITTVLTLIWVMYVLATGVYFITCMVDTASSVVKTVNQELTKHNQGSAINNVVPGLKIPEMSDVFEITDYYALGWVYIGFVIIGIIAFLSLLVAVCQKNPCPIIIWFIFLTIGVILHVIFSIIHCARHDNLIILFKLDGFIFVAGFIYPWIVMFAYYQELRNSSVRRATVTQPGQMINQPRQMQVFGIK